MIVDGQNDLQHSPTALPSQISYEEVGPKKTLVYYKICWRLYR